MLKTGLVGAGVFAGYHAGKIAGSALTEFVGVFAACDAVLIACPATYHEEMAAQAIEAHCHILVEKPLALTAMGAERLVKAADVKRLIVQVGHQERLVIKAMGLSQIKEIPTRIEAVRASPPSPEGRASDVSVIWDLMIHDLDLAAHLMGHQGDVSGEGEIMHTGKIDDARVSIAFEQGEASFNASRAAPERDRRMKLTYPSGFIDINFLTRDVINTTPYEVRLDVSEDLPDPLGAADEAFFAACLGQADTPISGRSAIEAVRLAELAERSVLKFAGVTQDD